MKKQLRYYPFFPFLLPLFFVLHGWVENAAFISLRNCYGLLFSYLVIAAVLYFLLYLFYRHPAKAAIALGLLQAVSFFFGALHDVLIRYGGFSGKYSVILPVLAVLITVTLIWLKRTKRQLKEPVLFFNVLLLVYLVTDTASAIFRRGQRPHQIALATPLKQRAAPCDTCSLPDVYFLLMDEYASTAALRKWYGYDNSSLDSFLRDNGFHIAANSRSNYNFTSFSMASILNMSYLQGFEKGNISTLADYASCNNLIRDCDVIKQFSSRGYDIVNYSIFDLQDKPSEFNLRFLPVKINLITSQTLWNRVRRDIGWNITGIPLQAVRKQIYQISNDNDHFIDETIKATSTPSKRPRFIYVHLVMPHNPFFYDRSGRLREPGSMGKGIQGYLDYLPYTNGVIKKLVTSIRQNKHDPAVIIMMGDHGMRYPIPGDSAHTHYFENQNAVYFPDGDYHLFYDSISGVNQFRVVLNTLFHQQMPLLTDSTIYLTDKGH
jgi:hypothetical protein